MGASDAGRVDEISDALDEKPRKDARLPRWLPRPSLCTLGNSASPTWCRAPQRTEEVEEEAPICGLAMCCGRFIPASCRHPVLAEGTLPFTLCDFVMCEAIFSACNGPCTGHHTMVVCLGGASDPWLSDV